MQIPKTIKQAEKALTSLDKLATATDWERAAIVWAFTYEGKPGEGGPGRNAPDVARCTIRQFAALKLPGLTSHSTIERYRDAWLKAMDEEGAPDIGPGDVYRKPEMDFPKVPYTFAARKAATEETALRDPVKVAAAINRGDVDLGKVIKATEPAKVEKAAPKVQDIVDRAERKRSRDPGAPKMPTPDGNWIEPQRKGGLGRLADVLELGVVAQQAEGLASKFTTQRSETFLTGEEVAELVEDCKNVISAWEAVADALLNPVADDAAAFLADQ